MKRMMMVGLISASVAGGLGSAARSVPQSSSLAAREGACTAKWLTERESRPLAERYRRKTADAFGRQCLGITGPVPIDWAQVRRDLAAAIPITSALVTTVPADVDAFCPGYRRADPQARAAFWRELAYETIKPEAGSNAHALMFEQPMANGKPVGGYYSVGLLQLSYHDGPRFGCGFTDERSLLDPRLNIACGAKIIERLVTRDRRIGGDAAHGRSGLGAYWSTIRVIGQKPRAAGARETRAPIVNAVRRLPQCSA